MVRYLILIKTINENFIRVEIYEQSQARFRNGRNALEYESGEGALRSKYLIIGFKSESDKIISIRIGIQVSEIWSIPSDSIVDLNRTSPKRRKLKFTENRFYPSEPMRIPEPRFLSELHRIKDSIGFFGWVCMENQTPESQNFSR